MTRGRTVPTPWDAYVTAVTAVTVFFAFSGDAGSPSARTGALVLVGVLALWCAAWGRAGADGNLAGRRASGYVGGSLLLFLPAVALLDAPSFLLWVLCPQAYMLLPVVRATVTVVVLNVLYVAVVLARTGDLAATVRGPLPVAVLAVVSSVVIGTAASRVSRQNDERAELIAQLQASRAQVATLSHEAGVAAERQRLAADIHDTIAQGLSSVLMLIQAADAELRRDPDLAGRHLALAAGTARDNLAEARALVGALTPTALAGSSLPDALARLVEQFHAQTGVQARFSAPDGLPALSTTIEVVLLRAAQESLANVGRHAGADRVTVTLRHVDPVLVLEVRDDGCGFAGAPAGGGYGLGAMRARVEQVAGVLTVESVPAHGTTVRVEVPTS